MPPIPVSLLSEAVILKLNYMSEADIGYLITTSNF